MGSETRFEKEMKKYFRPHCDQVLDFVAMGSVVLLHLPLKRGEFWLKLLVTLDDIPEHAAESYNDLCMVRAMEKRNKAPGEFADFTPDGAYLSRADRASTPVPFEYVRPGVRRQRAKAHLDTLFDMMRKGTKVDQVWVDAAKKEMEEAEAASLSSLHEFTSYWTRQRQDVRPACSRWCSRRPWRPRRHPDRNDHGRPDPAEGKGQGQGRCFDARSGPGRAAARVAGEAVAAAFTTAGGQARACITSQPWAPGERSPRVSGSTSHARHLTPRIPDFVRLRSGECQRAVQE